MATEPKRSGIYKIVNTVNGHLYVGSAVFFKRRWALHKSELRKNRHHSPKLQNAWNKHGERTFEFSVIEECEPIKEVLEEREQFWMDYYKAYDNHNYNISKIAGRSMQGRKHSEYTKEKISGANNCRYGKKHTPEAIQKMRESAKNWAERELKIRKKARREIYKNEKFYKRALPIVLTTILLMISGVWINSATKLCASQLSKPRSTEAVAASVEARRIKRAERLSQLPIVLAKILLLLHGVDTTQQTC